MAFNILYNSTELLVLNARAMEQVGEISDFSVNISDK